MSEISFVKQAVLGLEDKLAQDVKVIDVHEITTITDYIIIASGKNKNQLQALCDSVQEKLVEAGALMKNREGSSNGGWILLDYYDIIVHIFGEEERSFYDLDHIWRDGNHIPLGDL